LNQRIQKFQTDGTYAGSWGSAGSGPGQFQQPLGIGIDEDGIVYVSDYNNSRVQMFDLGGAYIGEFGTYGAGLGEFYRPRALAVTGDGTVFVGDTENQRVSRWGSKITAASRVSWGEVRRRYR